MFTLIVRVMAVVAGITAAGVGFRVMAQETGAPGSQVTPPQPRDIAPVKQDHRFFDCPIDLWRKGLSYDEAEGDPEGADAKGAGPRQHSEKESESSDWGQSVRLPSGEMARFELPRPLVRVLEDPSDANIKAYLDWKQVRTGKILRAAERMKKYQKQTGEGSSMGGATAEPQGEKAKPQAADGVVSAPPSPPQAGPPAGSPAGDTAITYFRRPGCRWCDRQDAALADWLKARPGVTLDVVEHGTRPELWKEHQVRGTPTMLLKDTKTGRTRLLEGFTDKSALDEVWAGLRAQPPPREDPSTGSKP